MKKKDLIFIITWFLCSIILMTIFKDIPSILIIFGQMFIVTGLYSTIKLRKKLYNKFIITIFPVLGFILLIIGLILKLNLSNLNTMIPILISSSFIAFGIIAIISVIYRNKHEKKENNENKSTPDPVMNINRILARNIHDYYWGICISIC